MIPYFKSFVTGNMHYETCEYCNGKGSHKIYCEENCVYCFEHCNVVHK